ncbi:MAG: hypothetical protein IPJ07_10855 [Acidobacteria bacterium]|nr:hypothetical protein [Acidobacteriota bacterium]
MLLEKQTSDHPPRYIAKTAGTISSPAPHSIQAEVAAPEFLPEQPMMIEEPDAAAIEPKPLQPPLEVETEEEVSGIIPESVILESLIGGTWFNRIGIFADCAWRRIFSREAFRRMDRPAGTGLADRNCGRTRLLFAAEKIRSRDSELCSTDYPGRDIDTYPTFLRHTTVIN